MDDLDRFFPVIPRNVPPDDLADYLRLYSDEAGAFLASQRSNAPPNGYERFVNGPFPRMHNLRGLSGYGIGAVGQPLGPDPSAFVNTQAGTMLVAATWAQRGANAFLATIGASPIAVDGVVGSQTLTALRLAQRYRYAQQTNTVMPADTGQTSLGGTPMPARSGSGVALSRDLAGYLATLMQVADPPRATTSPAPAPVSTPPPGPSPIGGGTSLMGGWALLFGALFIGVVATRR